MQKKNLIKKEINGKSYTVPLSVMKDTRLSTAARGAYGLLCAYPDGFPEKWQYSVRKMTACIKNGHDKLMNTLKELEQAGYIRKIPIPRENNRIQWVIILTDQPFEFGSAVMDGISSVVKAFQTENREMFSIAFAKDKTLSLEERGAFMIVATQTPEWNLTIENLASILPEGTEFTKTKLQTLKKRGYISSIQTKKAGRYSSSITTLNMEPDNTHFNKSSV